MSAAAPPRAKGMASVSSKSKSATAPSSKARKKSVASRHPKGQRKASTSSSSSDKEQPSTASTPSPFKKKKFVAPLFPFGAATRTRSKSGFNIFFFCYSLLRFLILSFVAGNTRTW